MSTIRVARRTKFTSVDRETVNDHRLSFRARGLLVWLLDKPDDWHATSESIARQATEGRDAVRSALRELEVRGYLRREKEQDISTGQWSTITTVYERPPGDGFPGVGKPAVGNPGVGEPGAKTDHCSPTTETENTQSPPATLDLSLAEPFEEFWKLYPRKEGKDAARIKFRAAARRAKPDDIIAGLTARIDWWTRSRTDRRYIPLPATWLNQGRWADELPPVERAGVAAATRAQDRDAAVLDEVNEAIAAGDGERAWAIIRERGSVHPRFSQIVRMLDERGDATIAALVEVDETVVAEIRRLRDNVRSAAAGESIELPYSLTEGS